MSNMMVASQAKKLAIGLNIEGDEKELVETLKATVFKGNPTDAQMTALLIVASQYNLNPFTREIFAYPDKQNGIVPVVSVDGWIKIITTHPQYDGMEFKYSDEIVTIAKAKPCPSYVECAIFHKDRSRPTVIREYLDEAYKETTYASPWQTHTKRFLRHRALIQCGRVAFGLSGIYEPDEADNIVPEKIINPMPNDKPPVDISALLKSITVMSLEDFKTIDKDSLTVEQQRLVSEAFKARKAAIKEASVVAEVKAEVEPDGVDWVQMLTDATDQREFAAILESVPDEELKAVYERLKPELREKAKDDYDVRLDLMRPSV